jgi:signal-transduction protein with cAMP-binding, CBS, and nucleotidyltransferase domain
VEVDMGTVLDVLDSKVSGRQVRSTQPGATILEAVEQMCRERVGALLVMDRTTPVGIVSERDVMTRGVLKRRSPDATAVANVMTKEVVCVGAEASVEEAMAIMTHRHCRHLPVVDAGKVVGMVSIGDLARWASHQQEYELKLLHDYVEGRYPG